jgi:hypothetical protein
MEYRHRPFKVALLPQPVVQSGLPGRRPAAAAAAAALELIREPPAVAFQAELPCSCGSPPSLARSLRVLRRSARPPPPARCLLRCARLAALPRVVRARRRSAITRAVAWQPLRRVPRVSRVGTTLLIQAAPARLVVYRLLVGWSSILDMQGRGPRGPWAAVAAAPRARCAWAQPRQPEPATRQEKAAAGTQRWGWTVPG